MQKRLGTKEVKVLGIIRKHVNYNGLVPSVRQVMKELDYKSPRSAALLMRALEDKGILEKKGNGRYILKEYQVPSEMELPRYTVKIPLLGSVACGSPIFAEENIEAEVSVSTKLVKTGHKYFLLKAEGDSMDLAGINDGNLVLIRQQQHAENDDLVLALIDDHATIKKYRHNGNHILLLPQSSNRDHQPIIMSEEFRIQGVVESVIALE
ncbi:transcriptional repressor LexA [Croceitalea sp. MTPC9]|uniref:transcriptional repressor LexA n=1 Tax=unclassified Croceitalea TaxID=2632280 RepID=UPI002B3F015F|nr:transcriptional repressor LexA [Croceitalea sp. MTPC6]GMN16093.1 transcriptional repressor LexA [Croceitalea sp. MTPC9]